MDEKKVHAWKIASQDDYVAAQSMSDDEFLLHGEVVCYHAEQAVEKLVKAFLVSRGEENPEGPLSQLWDRAVAEEPALEAWGEKVGILCDYASPIPGVLEIARDEMDAALRDAGDILDALDSYLPN